MTGAQGRARRTDPVLRRAVTVTAAALVIAWSVVLGAARPGLAMPGQTPTPPTTQPTSPPPTPTPPSGPRIRLVSQTPWVTPGGELRLVVATTDVPDLAGVDVAVSVYPRVTNRADLSTSFTGEGLRSALWQRPGGPVRLADLPSSADGSRTITIPTQDPSGALDRTRARVQSGIYPVEVLLLTPATGDTIDRLVTHLLAPEAPKDGSKLGVVTLLPINAPPAIARDGTRTGPPQGTANIAAVAAGLASTPNVPITAVANPETLEALAAGSPETAQGLVSALAGRPVVARPYVPLRVPSLGEQGDRVVRAELEAGTAALTAALGRAPTSTAWVADEPLDTPALGELFSAGVREIVVASTALAPAPTTRADRGGFANAVPRQPVPVSAGAGRSVQALVADPALATHTEPAIVAADQPLAAHKLLTELAGIVLLPQARGGTVPPQSGLAGGVATLLPSRTWQPTQAFLTALLSGLEQSPILAGVDPSTAFALATPAPTASTSATTARRRNTTTTTPPDERTLQRIIGVDSRLGRSMATASAAVDAHTAVLPGAPNDGVSPRARSLAAASADLPVDEQLQRLSELADALDGDLKKIRIPKGSDLVLTSRRGVLPIGIVNDAPAEARVLLRVSSEKLAFPDGDSRAITLGRQHTTERLRVSALTAGSFPMRVTLLTPDGSRELDKTEIGVRSTSLPPIGVAVSVAAGLVLAFWWGRTLLFRPRGRHLR